MNKQKLNEKCVYDKPDGCHAMACYSQRQCGARDKHGYPKYVVIVGANYTMKLEKEEICQQRILQ